jgi:DNA processing protein
MKVNSLKLNDGGYPPPLTVIPAAPKVLFWIGADPSEWLDKPKVAIVGSRKVSAYGKDVTARITDEVARAGIVVISGLAYGVDSIAHQAALDAGSITVAVLPTALDNIYPAGHTDLAKRIIAGGGTLISEYPLGSTPHKSNFTARNRIVSGLADLVLITEAATRSGTLNTARFALEQGKTVAAVPGNITSPNSQGTNNLIKSGALPVTEAGDVLFALNISAGKAREQRAFRGSAEEEALLALIRSGISDQEELALLAGLDGAAVAGVLISLELAGCIKPAGGGQWLLG